MVIIIMELIPVLCGQISLTWSDYAGGVRCDSEASGGSVEQVARQLPQVFSRLCCPSFPQLPDAQLHHFTAQVRGH